MLAHSSMAHEPDGGVLSKMRRDTKVLVGKFPTKDAVVAESFTAKNVVKTLYPKAKSPDNAIQTKMSVRKLIPAASTSASVHPLPSGIPPRCAAHASGTGCCQNSPGTIKKQKDGKAIKPMALMGDNFKSVPIICFITKSAAPQNTEARHSNEPKRNVPLETKFPSVLAITVPTAHTTPSNMHAHSGQEALPALSQTTCKTAVASGMQARITWLTDNGIKARLKLFRPMFKEKATAKHKTKNRCRMLSFVGVASCPAVRLRHTARMQRKRQSATSCCKPVTRKEAGKPKRPSANCIRDMTNFI
mmetsp:Transcript_19510/g.52342  ORF Transcript_19510/g.52342 Transcript_19510/m.52342 type:complete len:303 (+) Transcript_19510:527-1435(+)